MNIPVDEDISDPPNSRYQVKQLLLGYALTPTRVESIAFRRDAEPVHPLFYDTFFRGLSFCTEALAMRVLKAGCTGVRFFDPGQLSRTLPKRFRTVRGIEEDGEWDPVKKIARTKLIEAID